MRWQHSHFPRLLAFTILANLFCARARMLVTMCPIHSRPLDIQTELTVNYTQTVLA